MNRIRLLEDNLSLISGLSFVLKKSVEKIFRIRFDDLIRYKQKNVKQHREYGKILERP